MTGCLGLFGLAQKAGCLVIGEDQIKAASYDHRTKAVFITADAGANTVKWARQITEYGKAPLAELPFGKEELGNALGRGALAAAAVTDAEFASGIMKKLAAADPEKYGAPAELLESRAKAKRTREKGPAGKNGMKRKERA